MKTSRRWIELDYNHQDSLRAVDIPYDSTTSIKAAIDNINSEIGGGIERPPQEVLLVTQQNVTIDATNGNVYHLTLDNTTDTTMVNPTNAIPGQKITIRFVQPVPDGTSYAVWDSAFRFSSSLVEPVLSTDPGLSDYCGFVYNGQDSRWDFVGFVFGFF